MRYHSETGHRFFGILAQNVSVQETWLAASATNGWIKPWYVMFYSDQRCIVKEKIYHKFDTLVEVRRIAFDQHSVFRLTWHPCSMRCGSSLLRTYIHDTPMATHTDMSQIVQHNYLLGQMSDMSKHIYIYHSYNVRVYMRFDSDTTSGACSVI